MEEPQYRILIPLGETGGLALLEMAMALAHQKGGEVLPLQVISSQGEERDLFFRQALEMGKRRGVSVRPITRVARSVSQAIVEVAAEEESDLVLLGWRGYTAARSAALGRVLDPVIRNLRCDVAVVRGEALPQVRTLLLPTAGGPHASAAAGLALALAKEYGATITALYICRPGATAEDEEEGGERIAHTFAGLETDDLVESKVLIASGVVRGILEEAEKHDITLLGASEESLLDQFLFGPVPERIASQSSKMVVMVKRYRGLARFWLYRLWRSLYNLFPTLSEEERLAVYRALRRGARPDVDYFVMMSLASVMATLGLVLNSAAVIIGAMLVAPLITPVLAISLGIVQGDARLLRYALESTIKGVILAILLAALLAAVSPLVDLNAEILARTRPTLVDLIVALASGAAGAYAIARKDVSEALPGVAVAAALVPPLGVTGIGIAMRNTQITGGALLLFATNLTAISLIGSLTFLLLGFRPAVEAKERRVQLRRGLVISSILLLIISLPLAYMLVGTVRLGRERQAIHHALTAEIEEMEGISLVDFQFEHRGEEVSVTVTVYAEEQLSPEPAQLLSSAISEEIGQPVSVKVIAVPITEVESRSP